MLQSPYAIDTINLKKDFLEKPIDIEKFKAFLEKEEIPLAIAWQGDSLHFYTKDRSILDNHLDHLLEKMVNDPEKLSDFSMDKSLDDAIDEVKSQITFNPNHSYLSQLDVTYKTPDLMSHFLPPHEISFTFCCSSIVFPR